MHSTSWNFSYEYLISCFETFSEPQNTVYQYSVFYCSIMAVFNDPVQIFHENEGNDGTDVFQGRQNSIIIVYE